MTAIPTLSDADALAKFDNYENALESPDDVFNALFGDDTDKVKDAPKEPSEDDTEEDDDTRETNDDDAKETDEDAEEPSDEDDESEDDDDTQQDEDGTEDEDDDAPKKKFADDDETYVKIKEGDKEHEVSVKDLKRLWGQEASLTRKSQEVADLRKTVDANQAKNIAAYDILLKKSTERADSYRNLPWTTLMRDQNIPNEQLVELQKEAQKAFEEESFLKNEIDGFMKTVADTQLTERKKAATECLKSINDNKSPHHIKGWSDALYNDIRTFATAEMGLNSEMVHTLTDPGAFKVLHMAMQFARGQKKVLTKKVNKQPTRIVKNSAAAPAARVGSGAKVKAGKAVAQAIKTGTNADAIEAFLALEG